MLAPTDFCHTEYTKKVTRQSKPWRLPPRFIANKASYQFKHAEMDTMLEKLRAQLQNKEEAK